MKKRVRLTIVDEMLATNPGDKEIYSTFIAKNAPDAETRKEELEHLPVDEMEKREMTIFFRDEDGNPEIPTHHIYGFFKSACGGLRYVASTKSKKLTAYKKKIDLLIKVFPADDMTERFIKINLPEEGKEGVCQRSLRASTMQGDRVALASSETVPAGSWVEFNIVSLDDGLWDTIEEWLDFGIMNGLGCWRNSGKGAFVWQYVDDSGNGYGGNFEALAS